MKVHQWHAMGWLIWAVFTVGFFAVWEYIGLQSRTDNKFPLTYYIRAAVGNWRNPLWWELGAILIWLFIHFLFFHD